MLWLWYTFIPCLKPVCNFCLDGRRALASFRLFFGSFLEFMTEYTCGCIFVMMASLSPPWLSSLLPRPQLFTLCFTPEGPVLYLFVLACFAFLFLFPFTFFPPKGTKRKGAFAFLSLPPAAPIFGGGFFWSLLFFHFLCERCYNMREGLESIFVRFFFDFFYYSLYLFIVSVFVFWFLFLLFLFPWFLFFSNSCYSNIRLLLLLGELRRLFEEKKKTTYFPFLLCSTGLVLYTCSRVLLLLRTCLDTSKMVCALPCVSCPVWRIYQPAYQGR